MKSDSLGEWITRWIVARIARFPFGEIKRAYTKARGAGMAIDWNFLGAHSQAGGDVESLVDGLIYAQEEKIVLPLEKAAAYELVAKMSHRISLRDYLTPFVQEGIRHHSKMPLG